MRLAQIPDFKDIERSIDGFRFAGQDLSTLFENYRGLPGITTTAFFIAGLLLLLYLIYGGLAYMLSRGDQKALESAKNIITNALVGFIVVFIAFWIVQIIGLFLGLPGITGVFGGQ